MSYPCKVPVKYCRVGSPTSGLLGCLVVAITQIWISVLRHDNRNHTSALDFPADVDAYLAEKLRYGAILGLYVQSPIPDCHFSPFMTCEKSTSTNRHVINDLCWPKDYSVNAGVDKNSYLGTDFVLSFPTIDDITEVVKKVGKGAHLYKIDVSRAFRHVRLDPHNYDLLGLNWKGVMYVDTMLPNFSVSQ